ncbi:MAG: DeoR/GlpR family DNA-binding transcription regulator [Candidatus Enteromonas sp.]|nr:DeoR/GlpR family DNA-binding transcription regulator [Candidatus Enteromonas sp.]
MIIEERYSKILEILKEKRLVSYNELSSLLFVSSSTIRRDVASMAKKGLLAKVHNGAALLEGNAEESPSLIRESEHVKEKRLIASLTRPYLLSGMTFFMDSSTTCAQLIPLLNEFSNLIAITNGIGNALELASAGVEVLIPGGTLFAKNTSVVGSETIDFLKRFSPDFFFFSARGLTENGILSESNESTRAIKDVMIQKAKKKILLIDSSKIGKSYFTESGTMKDIDVLITDSPLPESLKKICIEEGVEVVEGSEREKGAKK